MKKPAKKILPLCLFLFLTFLLKSQTTPPVIATVYELEINNVATVADQIIQHINEENGAPGSDYFGPPIDDLVYFLQIPFENDFYEYSPQGCPNPGMQAIGDSVITDFQFENLSGTTGHLLFMGTLDYHPLTLSGSGAPEISFAVHGPEVFEGVAYETTEVSYHIIMVGTYCSGTTPGSTTNYYSKIDIVIVDKNVL